MRVERLAIALGEFKLRELDLEVASGEYFVVLGPTGAGKTILLECIAGLHRPDAGRIFLHDHDVTRWPIERRGVGYVPQDYALFPNMTARRNIGFGLRMNRVPAAEAERRISESAKWLGIEAVLDRLPITFSGGEKQRVALARALVVRPALLLLDEPLAAVDESARHRLAAELRDIQRASGVTVLHVCHNFEEAVAVADRMAVLHDGRIVQCGTADDIFQRPASRFVAEFTRAENVFEVAESRASGDHTVVALRGGIELRAWQVAAPKIVVVRPEHLRLSNGARENVLAVKVEHLSDRGAVRHVAALDRSGRRWVAILPRRETLGRDVSPGTQIELSVPPEHVHLI